MAKLRLDAFLVQKKYFESREKAKAAILAGCVKVNGFDARKPGTMVELDGTKVSISEQEGGFVSRGGKKLQKALEVFPIQPAGRIAVDVGASTGGFTDCLLKHHAKKVYAVDVGYGQLDWRLRQDERVVVMERTNARYLKREDFSEAIELAVMDASFISLKLLLPAVFEILCESGETVALIKPQFEAGKEQVGKKGVVRDAKVHIQVIRKVTDFARTLGFSVAGLDFSPIKGPNGNIEYLLYLTKLSNEQPQEDIESRVCRAHTLL